MLVVILSNDLLNLIFHVFFYLLKDFIIIFIVEILE